MGLRQVAAADSTQLLTYDVTRTGRYVLRLQPELLVSGEFQIEFHTTASIIFPVSGKDSRAIQSRFGAPREAGRRIHHGVDNIARGRTPVIAAVDGVISMIRNGGLGGKTIWLRQSGTGTNYYYAHLDEQLVNQGSLVSAGDTLGLVGNTGNARTTPLHLHFGIYSNGPIDPYPFVHAVVPSYPRISFSQKHIGTWMRTSTEDAVFYRAPSRRPSQIRTIERYTSVRVVAASGDYFSVRLPDETTEFFSARVVESTDSSKPSLFYRWGSWQRGGRKSWIRSRTIWFLYSRYRDLSGRAGLAPGYTLTFLIVRALQGAYMLWRNAYSRVLPGFSSIKYRTDHFSYFLSPKV